MKEISLTQGKVALVDMEDYDYLNQWKWCAVKWRNRYYATRGSKKDNGKQTIISMHRLIMKTPKDMDTDHINGDGLDNRRDNLRVCNCAQNQRNRGKQNNNQSGLKGVSWHKKGKKWITQLKLNKKNIYLGLFKNKERAAVAYNEAATKYHGEFARLNEI